MLVSPIHSCYLRLVLEPEWPCQFDSVETFWVCSKLVPKLTCCYRDSKESQVGKVVVVVIISIPLLTRALMSKMEIVSDLFSNKSMQLAIIITNHLRTTARWLAVCSEVEDVSLYFHWIMRNRVWFHTQLSGTSTIPCSRLLQLGLT